MCIDISEGEGNETIGIENQKNVIVDETIGEVELVVTDTQGESVELNSEDHFFQEYEKDESLLENQEYENTKNEQTKTIDNKWYTFVSNDNGSEAEMENQFEEDQLQNNEIKEGDEIQTSMCKEGFAQKVLLDQHEMNHTGGVQYECTICNKKFSKSGKLKIHERIHKGLQPYNCKTCYKRFNQSGDLKRHERIHTGEAPYQCTLNVIGC